MERTKRKVKPGDIVHRAPSDPSPGIMRRGKRTILDPEKVFVLVDGKEIRLSALLVKSNRAAL